MNTLQNAQFLRNKKFGGNDSFPYLCKHETKVDSANTRPLRPDGLHGRP
jgi:hypothetical protein